MLNFSDFIPTVSNREPGSGKGRSKTGMILGVVAGIAVIGLITVISILFWRHKKKIAEINKGTILLYFHIIFRRSIKLAGTWLDLI